MTRLLAAIVPAALLAFAVITVGAIRWQRGQSPGFGLQDLFGIALGHYQNIGAGIGTPRPNLLRELTTQLSAPVVLIGLTGLVASAIFGDWRQALADRVRRVSNVRHRVPGGILVFALSVVYSPASHHRSCLWVAKPLVACGATAATVRNGSPRGLWAIHGASNRADHPRSYGRKLVAVGPLSVF